MLLGYSTYEPNQQSNAGYLRLAAVMNEATKSFQLTDPGTAIDDWRYKGIILKIAYFCSAVTAVALSSYNCLIMI